MSQSYDGASNMRGAINGLQSRIGSRSPQAIYNWCYAHRMNLVIESLIASCTPVRNAVGILEELYVFFGGHKRHDAFYSAQENYSHKKTLKRTGNSTRTWRSVEDATQVVLSRFKELRQSLQELSQSSDTSTVTGAQGLFRQLDDFRMILTLHVVDEILQVTGPCSRIFQAISTDLAIAVSTIERCKSTLQARRADRSHFETMCQRARQFAEMHGIDPVLTQQLRRKKDGVMQMAHQTPVTTTSKRVRKRNSRKRRITFT